MVYKAVKADTKGLTDRGKVREVNEDQFLIASLHKVVEVEETSLPQDEREQFHHSMMARLLLVADGVGGSAAGEKASGLALKAITSYVANTMQCFYRLDVELQDDLLDALETSVRRSHAMVLSMAQETTEYKGMATTLTMAHILWPRAYIVQVGDSRCYLGRGSGPHTGDQRSDCGAGSGGRRCHLRGSSRAHSVCRRFVQRRRGPRHNPCYFDG